MMSKSSSKHLTAKMKLLLVTLACVAAAVAAPAEKQKRDILPGDPRYGTDYHHQHHHTHENEVQITPAVGGYVGSYVAPGTDVLKNSFQVLHKTYGPPNHTPGTPLGNNGYLAPSNTEVHRTSVPLPNFDVVDTVKPISHHVSKTYLQPAIQEAKKIHTTTSYEVPIHDGASESTFTSEFNVPAPSAPVTSYGTPVSDTKTSVDVHDTVVEPTLVSHEKVAVTKVHRPVETKTIVTSQVQPTVNHGVFQQSVNEFKSVPSTSFEGFGTHTTNFNTFPSFDTTFTKASVPSTLYQQQSFNTGFPSSYPGTFQTNYPSFPSTYETSYPSFQHHTTQFQVPQQPISVHVTKQAPISIPIEVSRPYVFHTQQPIHVQYPQIVETKVPVVHHQHVELPKTEVFHHQHVELPKTQVFQHQHVELPKTQVFHHQQIELPKHEVFHHQQIELPKHEVFHHQPVELPKTTEVVHQHVPSFQHNYESFQVPSVHQTTTFSKPVHNVHVEDDAVTVENPLTHTKTKEYVQPIAENGGYVY